MRRRTPPTGIIVNDLLLPEPGATLNRFRIKLPNPKFVEFYECFEIEAARIT
jgi:hypothetical protein